MHNAQNATGASISPENGLQFNLDQAVKNPAMLYYSEVGNTAASDEFENKQNSWNATGASINLDNSLQFGPDEAVEHPAMRYYSETGNRAAAAVEFDNVQNACNVTDASISLENDFQPGPDGSVFTRDMGEVAEYDDDFNIGGFILIWMPSENQSLATKVLLQRLCWFSIKQCSSTLFLSYS